MIVDCIYQFCYIFFSNYLPLLIVIICPKSPHGVMNWILHFLSFFKSMQPFRAYQKAQEVLWIYNRLWLLKDSSQRIVKRKSTTVVHAVRSCIAPGQERKLLKLIQPAETDDEETKCLDQSELVELIIKLFQNHQMHIQKDINFLWYAENKPKKNYRT